MRGDQIEKYGYAAFGLTVVPYLIMSIINLFSIMLTPDYPAMYMVHTDIMEEAKRRQGRFDLVVGKIPETSAVGNVDGIFKIQDGRTFVYLSKHTPAAENQASKITSLVELVSPDHPSLTCSRNPSVVEYPNYSGNLKLHHNQNCDVQKERLIFVVGFVIALISLVIVGAMSGFKKGSNSTGPQRVLLMMWLVFGIIVSPHYVLLKWGFFKDLSRNALWQYRLTGLFYGVPASFGFVIVAQEIYAYGTCMRIY